MGRATVVFIPKHKLKEIKYHLPDILSIDGSSWFYLLGDEMVGVMDDYNRIDRSNILELYERVMREIANELPDVGRLERVIELLTRLRTVVENLGAVVTHDASSDYDKLIKEGYVDVGEFIHKCIEKCTG